MKLRENAQKTFFRPWIQILLIFLPNENSQKCWNLSLPKCSESDQEARANKKWSKINTARWLIASFLKFVQFLPKTIGVRDAPNVLVNICSYQTCVEIIYLIMRARQYERRQKLAIIYNQTWLRGDLFCHVTGIRLIQCKQLHGFWNDTI